MTTVDALKKLYVALGGDINNVINIVNNAEMVDALAGLVSKGSLLPSVTSADNGKVLVVDGGEWTAAEALPADDRLLPNVTSDDNGKVLAVNEGEWTAADALPADDRLLPEVTSDDNGKTMVVAGGEWTLTT